MFYCHCPTAAQVRTHLLNRSEGRHVVIDRIQQELMRTELGDWLAHSERLLLTNRRPSKVFVHRAHWKLLS